MPYPVDIPDGERPTIITKPNQRFATTALSTEYRAYAANGELLKDNTSGELFLKRKIDGKVVSFFQNRKMLHDIALELRVLLTTNAGFTYPTEEQGGVFVCSNYDLTAINHEKLPNFYLDPTLTINTDDPNLLYTLQFPVNKHCNGFFMNVTTRDCDKPALEYLTMSYNKLVENYDGNDPDMLSEKTKFREAKWAGSNVVLSYTLTCIYTGADGYGEPERQVYAHTAYLHANETSFVAFPDANIRTDFPHGVDYYFVEVNSISFEKLKWSLNHTNFFPENFMETLEKFQIQDQRMETQNVMVMYYMDEPEDYVELGNDTILAFMDVTYIDQYMTKMSALYQNGSYICSVRRPTTDVWSVNGAWAEMVRTIDRDGNVTETGSENSGLLGELEDIFGPTRIAHGLLTTKEDREFDFLVGETKDATE